MPLTGSASARAEEHGMPPHFNPLVVPRAADWDKLPCLKGWNTTSKHYVDQRWKQQAFPAGSSFRPSSRFSFHFESDNAAWTRPFIRLQSSRHRWDGACISLSAGYMGHRISRAQLSSIRVMEKIYQLEQGRCNTDGVDASEQGLSCPRYRTAVKIHRLLLNG